MIKIVGTPFHRAGYLFLYKEFVHCKQLHSGVTIRFYRLGQYKKRLLGIPIEREWELK